MAKKDYIPAELGALRLWLVNYRAELIAKKAILGITDADFNTRINFIDLLIAKLDSNTTAQQAAQGERQGLNAQKTASLTNIRAGAQRDKKSVTYTTEIGEDMGIIGDEDSIDENTAKPILTGKKKETGYEISFSLLGHFDAVKIFRTRPGGIKTFIAIDTSSPYLDAEPMVNGTIYTAWFMMGDDTVGLESNALTVSI